MSRGHKAKKDRGSPGPFRSLLIERCYEVWNLLLETGVLVLFLMAAYALHVLPSRWELDPVVVALIRIAKLSTVGVLCITKGFQVLQFAIDRVSETLQRVAIAWHDVKHAGTTGERRVPKKADGE